MGYKIHLTNRGETPWHFECIEWEGPDDILAVAFVKMGRLDDDLDHVHLLEYVKDIPYRWSFLRRRRLLSQISLAECGSRKRYGGWRCRDVCAV